MKGTLMRSAENLAREHTERAIDTIANVMNDWCAEDRDRIAAANALLDRGHGKPVNAVIQVPANRQLQAQLAAMTDAELEERVLDQPLPRLAQLPIAADIEQPKPAGFPRPRQNWQDVIEVDAEPDPLTL